MVSTQKWVPPYTAPASLCQMHTPSICLMQKFYSLHLRPTWIAKASCCCRASSWAFSRANPSSSFAFISRLRAASCASLSFVALALWRSASSLGIKKKSKTFYSSYNTNNFVCVLSTAQDIGTEAGCMIEDGHANICLLVCTVKCRLDTSVPFFKVFHFSLKFSKILFLSLYNTVQLFNAVSMLLLKVFLAIKHLLECKQEAWD